MDTGDIWRSILRSRICQLLLELQHIKSSKYSQKLVYLYSEFTVIRCTQELQYHSVFR